MITIFFVLNWDVLLVWTKPHYNHIGGTSENSLLFDIAIQFLEGDDDDVVLMMGRQIIKGSYGSFWKTMTDELLINNK